MTLQRVLALRTTVSERHLLAHFTQSHLQHASSLCRTIRPVARIDSLSSWHYGNHSCSQSQWPQHLQAGYLLQSTFLHSQASDVFGRKIHTQSSQQLSEPRWSADQLPGIKAQLPKPVTNLKQRAVGYLRESLLLSYSAVFDNVIFRVAEWLRLDKLFQWITPGLENGYAAITGKKYKLKNGQTRSISLVNHTAFDFSIPEQYSAAEFPFLASQPPQPGQQQHTQRSSAKGWTGEEDHSFSLNSLYRAHFLSLCMKLVYEKREVIDDIASTHLGSELIGYYLTSDKDTAQQRHQQKKSVQDTAKSRAAFVPRTLGIVLGTPQAIVVAFRGTEPTNLINMRSSGKISMSHPEGMGGVHDGFWTALMYESGEEEAATLFDRLVSALKKDGDESRDIYLTGHSLGGALAAVFAQALHARGHKELADRVKGVHTFGGPRIGDEKFCQMLADNYPEQTFRYVHAADIIPKVPPRFLLYAHFPREIFLSSFGQLVLKTKDIARWHTIEAWGYLFIQLQKTFGNLIRFRESPVRTIYRLALLISIPGLSDHFPQDYEQLLRDQVKASSEKHTPITWSRNKQLSRVQQIVTGI